LIILKDFERPPIIDLINFKDTIIDVLHLFLRSTDILLKLLFNKHTDLDQNDGPNIVQRPYFFIFFEKRFRFFEKRRKKIFEDYINLDEPLAENRFILFSRFPEFKFRTRK
jgi:hypothetical protein